MNALRLLTACALFAWLLGPTAGADTVTTHPYCGITCITRTEKSPWYLSMHIVLIDLTTPGLRFKLTGPGGTRETIKQTTLDFLNQEHAQLAINAHFFVPFPPADPNDMTANVVGLAASEGTVFSPFEPQPVGSDYQDQSYAILPFAPALNIDRFNRASIVHRDPAYTDNKHLLEPVALWTALAGSAQIVTAGVRTIPTYSGPPDGLNALYGYSDSVPWYLYPDARTCIGLTSDNQTLVLYTVDYAGLSYGLSAYDVADLLIKDYQVYNALNLDGGGSTTMVLQDPATQIGQIVNIPDEAPGGRATGSNLAVFALPNTNSPVLAITMTATNSLVVSWPALASEWHLEQNACLSASRWVTVSAPPPQQQGDCMQIVVAAEGAGRFYRLAK